MTELGEQKKRLTLSAAVTDLAWLLPWVPGALCLIAGSLYLYESLSLAFASEAVIEEYHFGSEAMIGNGGWHYASHLTYVSTVGTTGVILLAAALFLALAAKARRLGHIVVALAVWAAGNLVLYAVGKAFFRP